MNGMLAFLTILLMILAWVGHAYILTALLNNLYGRRLPKTLLKPWRYLTGVLILVFPLLLWLLVELFPADFHSLGVMRQPFWVVPLLAYCIVCVYYGAALPFVTTERYLRRPPECVLREQTRTLDLWPELGERLIGDGNMRWLSRIPGNCIFKLDITELTLAPPKLPPELDGLTLLVVSDLHFHGTPSREYFERVLDELAGEAEPDIACLVGDYLDSDRHHGWIEPLLGRIRAREKFAILGNHDEHHDPQRISESLAAAGYTLLRNSWKEFVIRSTRCVAVGHEGPWFVPPPDLSSAPEDCFRLCLSHTPDNFFWAQEHDIGLMFSGHVHGGAIRLPLIGSIFVPSIYGRRFDSGTFEENGTVLAVNRGVSGKEPLRIRCNPQVLRVTLTTGKTALVSEETMPLPAPTPTMA